MKVPYPSNADNLYSLIHEAGHLMLGHNESGTPPNLAEFEAEMFAMNAMRSEGIPISAHVQRMIKVDMGTTIVQDMQDCEKIDPRAIKMAGEYLQRGGALGSAAFKRASKKYETRCHLALA